MKSFNIFGVHKGGSLKPNMEGGLPKNGGTWTACRFNEGLGKKEGIMFLRGDWYPNAHYAHIAKILSFT